MFSKWISFVICALLSLCDSTYVDTINKCSFKDDECVGKTVQNIIKDGAPAGIPELNIRSFDPFDISGLIIPVLGLLNISVEEGTAKGVKDCVIKHMHNDFNARVTKLDLLCDLTIKAKFKLTDISPIVQQLFGTNAISGNGNVMMKIDKISMKIKFFYDIIKKDDGEIYFNLHKDDLLAKFDIENLKMAAKKIFIGQQDLSEFVETLFNQNWKSMMPTFGNGMFKVALTVITDILGNFFNSVPAKYLYIEDITPYL